MGTWGAGLYSDDNACDIREDYKDILCSGIAEPDATNLIIEKWKESLSDPDISSVFWLVLADVQWNVGKLQESVKQEALKVIDNGSDLIRWSSNQKLLRNRKAVLAKLRRKLETSQPKEKKVKKRYVASTEWNIGDVFSFRLRSGKLTLLHVIGYHQDKGGRGPVCEILDWSGDEVPNKQELDRVGYKLANKPHQHLSQFLFGSLSPHDFKNDRVNFLIEEVKPKQKLSGYAVILWRSIDQQLDDLFGLR